jgi:hypothetical protein
MGRIRGDLDQMIGILEPLTPEEWTGLMVPHFPSRIDGASAVAMTTAPTPSMLLCRPRRTSRSGPSSRGAAERRVHFRSLLPAKLGSEFAGG